MRRIVLLTVCVLAAPWATMTHAAYIEGRTSDRQFSRYVDTDDPSIAKGLGCVKLCEEDLTPCDPTPLKKADERCAG